MKYLLLIFTISTGIAHACQLEPIEDDLSIDDITLIVDDIEYQASEQYKVSKHANDFLRKTYKDINNDRNR